MTLPARSILVAAGTQPNTVLAREDEHNVVLDGKYFQAVDEDGNPVKPERVAKPPKTRVLMSRAARWQGDQFLRRSASIFLRQRREGDGQRQAGLSRGFADSRASRSPLPEPKMLVEC